MTLCTHRHAHGLPKACEKFAPRGGHQGCRRRSTREVQNGYRKIQGSSFALLLWLSGFIFLSTALWLSWYVCSFVSFSFLDQAYASKDSMIASPMGFCSEHNTGTYTSPPSFTRSRRWWQTHGWDGLSFVSDPKIGKYDVPLMYRFWNWNIVSKLDAKSSRSCLPR